MVFTKDIIKELKDGTQPGDLLGDEVCMELGDALELLNLVKCELNCMPNTFLKSMKSYDLIEKIEKTVLG